MNAINRKLSLLLLAFTLISFTSCSGDIAKKREMLRGNWVLMGDQWHPGFSLTQDSIFPLLEQGDFLSLRPQLGQPYRLTKDSLIFGPPDYVENEWGLSKRLRGFWKINKLTDDSLIVEDHRGTMHFYKTSNSERIKRYEAETVKNAQSSVNTNVAYIECSTWDCLEKNKNQEAIISGVFQKYTPNEAGKGANHLFWDWEIRLADSLKVPVKSTDEGIDYTFFEGRTVSIKGTVFYGIIIGSADGQNATGFRIDPVEIEEKKE